MNIPIYGDLIPINQPPVVSSCQLQLPRKLVNLVHHLSGGVHPVGLVLLGGELPTDRFCGWTNPGDFNGISGGNVHVNNWGETNPLTKWHEPPRKSSMYRMYRWMFHEINQWIFQEKVHQIQQRLGALGPPPIHQDGVKLGPCAFQWRSQGSFRSEFRQRPGSRHISINMPPSFGDTGMCVIYIYI